LTQTWQSWKLRQMTLMPKSKTERALLVFGILLLLIGFSYCLADWHGNGVWEKYKREWEAKGEKLTSRISFQRQCLTTRILRLHRLLPPVMDRFWTNMDIK